jgi:hypothetical protein
MLGAEPGEDVSGITPSITSSMQLLKVTLSAQLGECNEIESHKVKLQEKESENRSLLELIQCAIQFENASQKVLDAELLSQKLQSLKEKLDDENIPQELGEVDLDAEVNHQQYQAEMLFNSDSFTLCDVLTLIVYLLLLLLNKS